MFSILLVDDEPIVKISMQRIIDWAKTRFRITCSASSGAAALKMVKTHQVDAVITDLQMPGMGGIALIHELRKRGFSGPILALSAYSDFELVRGALTEGAFDYLLKINLNADDLMLMLRKMAEIICENLNKAEDSRRNALLIEAQKKDLAVAYLHKFLLDSQETEPTPSADALFPAGFFPAAVCTVYASEKKIADMPASEFFKTMVNEIFEDVGSVFTLPVHSNELLCLISESAFFPAGKSISSRLTRLNTQLHTYTQIAPDIAYFRNAEDLSDAKKMYQICAQHETRKFYENDMSPVLLTDPQEPGDWETIRANYLADVRAAIRVSDFSTVQERTDAFMTLCTQTFYSSARLIETISSVLWFGRELCCFPIESEDLSEMVLRLKNAETIRSVRACLAEFWAAVNPAPNSDSPSVHREIQKAIQFVDESYMNKLTLDDVANHVGLSREYLSRLFKSETGESLFQYVTEVRMRKAAELLQYDKDILVKEVSLSVGIPNPYFFSKKFKNFYGVSPTNYYAKTNQAGETDPHGGQ